MRRATLVLCLLGATLPAYAASPAGQGFKKLNAAQIRQAFIGKTFSDDTHFSNRYKADGTIDGMSMGKKINNKWKLAKDALCIKDNIDELCYAVWAKGKEVQLIHENSDMVLSGSLK